MERLLLSSWPTRLGFLLTVVAASVITAPPALAQGPQYVVELGFNDRLPAGGSRYSTALGITSEGAIHVPSGPQGELTVADRMQPAQLAGLVQELHQVGRLREIRSPELAEQIRQACVAAGFAVEIDGAAETVLRCQSADGIHEVRCTALAVMAARFPDLPTLQRLLQVQLRLQNVAAVAQVGGEQACQQLAETANRTLTTTHPGVPPLSPRDVSMVRQLTSGSRYVQFYRAPEQGRDELLVSLFESPGTDPRVNVLSNPTVPVR